VGAVSRRQFLKFTVALAAVGAGSACAPAGAPGPAPGAAPKRLEVLRLDYAYYNPVSLVIRRKGWLEEEFGRDGIRVEWVLSLGSNKANEFTASGTVHFGSTAGSAALLARANGVPLKTVWLYSQPEWTALVTGKDSPIRQVGDLRGRKVAATRGTDPWFFLLRALDSAGLGQRDVEIVQLQHPDGEQALLQGQVDAWAGLDPHMAHAELVGGARLFFRRPEWNTYGTLNVLESFLNQYPDVVERVLAVYERGRAWARQNPQELVSILAEESKVTPEIARKVLTERTAFPDPVPGDQLKGVLREIIPLIQKEQLVPAGVDLKAAIEALVEPGPARQVLSKSASR
jgi:sulfonate transport system substrate-binding protein